MGGQEAGLELGPWEGTGRGKRWGILGREAWIRQKPELAGASRREKGNPRQTGEGWPAGWLAGLELGWSASEHMLSTPSPTALRQVHSRAK